MGRARAEAPPQHTLPPSIFTSLLPYSSVRACHLCRYIDSAAGDLTSQWALNGVSGSAPVVYTLTNRASSTCVVPDQDTSPTSMSAMVRADSGVLII